MASEVIFEGVKLALKYLYKRISARNKYLIVVANRESIAEDAKEFFKDHKLLFKFVDSDFDLSAKALEELTDMIMRVIDYNTSSRDVITIVLAGPCIIYAYLADRLHHSSRYVFFAQYDLKEKTYRYYKISKH